MPTPRKTPVDPPEEAAQAIPGTGGPLVDPEDYDDDFDSPEERVAEMLREIGADARSKVTVHRKGRAGTEYCGEFSASEFEEGGLELLRAAFGAGQYTIIVRGPLPQNPNKIGMRAKTVVNVAELRGSNPLVQIAGGAQRDNMPEFFRAIAEGQKQTLDAIMAIANKPPADPMAGLTTAFALMAQMKDVMGLNVAPPPPAQKSSIVEMVESFRELRAVANELSGKEPEQSDTQALIEAAKPLLEIVSKTLAKQPAQPEGAATREGAVYALPPVALPVVFKPSADASAEPRAATPTETQPSTTEPENMSQFTEALKLRAILTEFLAMIQRGEKLDDIVNFVAERLPDDLLDILELPGWWDMLAKAAPDVIPHEAKIKEVREAYMALPLEGGENGGETTPQENGPANPTPGA